MRTANSELRATISAHRRADQNRNQLTGEVVMAGNVKAVSNLCV
jgi:hypothetical protein